MTGRQFFATLEGGERLRAQLRKLESGVFLAGLRPWLEHHAARLLLLASRQEPKRRTGALAAGRRVVNQGSNKRRIRLAAAYISEGAAAAHEGLFGYAKLGARFARYKWFERVLNAYEPEFYEDAARALRALLEKHIGAKGSD